jgi:hypothetical protein
LIYQLRPSFYVFSIALWRDEEGSRIVHFRDEWGSIPIVASFYLSCFRIINSFASQISVTPFFPLKYHNAQLTQQQKASADTES